MDHAGDVIFSTPSLFYKEFHGLDVRGFCKDEGSRKFAAEYAGEAYVAAHSFKTKSLVNPHVLTNSDLMSINTPALFLVGENEKIYSAQQAVERLNTVAPKIETAIIPDAGHDLTMAQADLVNNLILEFLQKP